MKADDKPSPIAEKAECSANRSAPRWLELTEAAFLENCRFEAFRGPGPGGQKRNKPAIAFGLRIC